MADTPEYVKSLLEEYSSSVKEDVAGGRSVGRAVATGRKKIDQELRSMNANQMNALMGDEDALNELERNGFITTKTLTQDDVWKPGKVEELGLKFDEAVNLNHYNRTIDIGKKQTQVSKINNLTAGEGKGSIVIMNGVPYRLVKYTGAKQWNDGPDQRSGEIEAINLTNNKKEKIVPGEWRKL